MKAEIYMREQENAAEVSSVVMEQNQELQKRIPDIVAFLRDPGDEWPNLEPGARQVIPLRKIIDTPSCQPKSASSILQLADYCAFSIKRRLENKADGARLVAPLLPHFLNYGTGDGMPPFWNPTHMPSRWPTNVKFVDGEFKEVE